MFVYFIYIEIPCIILFLQKRYAHGTFAAGRAYMPTQEKKRLKIFGNSEISGKSQNIIEF